MRTVALTIIFIFLSTGFVAADQVNDQLEARRINISYNDVEFEECIRDLRSRTNMSIIISRQVDEGIKEEPINLSLNNITALNALNILVDYVYLEWCTRHGVIWISTPEDCMRRETILRIYDVRDITMVIQNFPGTRIRLRGNHGDRPEVIWEDEPIVDPVETNDLEDLIMQFTGGDSWNTNPNAVVMQVAGLLIIRQTVEVHREIQLVINMIRQNR